MRFQVPQFIEIEDKVIGPLTIKQFIYLAGGGGMAFIIYTYVPLYIAIILIVAVGVFSVSLAFYKVNNKPFIDFVEAAFLFYTKEKLYIWKKLERTPTAKENAPEEAPQVFVPRLSDSKLKELSWNLDINENMNPLTGEDGKNTR